MPIALVDCNNFYVSCERAFNPKLEPTDYTMRLVNAAIRGLATIYKAGFNYKKSGVLLMGLQPKHAVQAKLFDTAAQEKSKKLMQVMDSVNRRMGKGCMTIAAPGIKQRWAMRRDSKSPNYTTDWDALPVAMASEE